MGEQDVADQRGAFACREGPVTRVVAGPSCVWRGLGRRSTRLPRVSPLPSAGISSRRAACLSRVLPAIMSSGLVPGRLAAQRYRAMYNKQKRLAIWLDGEAFLFFETSCTLPSVNALWSFWHEDESAGDVGGSSSGWENAIRPVRVDLHGIGHVIFLRLATKS